MRDLRKIDCDQGDLSAIGEGFLAGAAAALLMALYNKPELFVKFIHLFY